MNQNRSARFELRLTPEEYETISQRADLAGFDNISAFIRKMALSGYIIRFEFPELRELTSLLKRVSNNVNQIARRVNANERVYDEDLKNICLQQEELFRAMRAIIMKLGDIG